MSLADLHVAVRAGLFSLLSADSTLAALIGPDRIYDVPPRGDAYPYLVLESIESRPLLAEIGDGAIHDLVLSVYSRGPSRDEAATAAGRAAEVLMAGPIPVSGHHVVNLTLANVVSRRLRDGRGFRASSALRAVTEPLQ